MKSQEYYVIYNACYGGFSISYKAYKWLIEHELEDKYLNREYNDECIESRKYVEIISRNDGSYFVCDTKKEQYHTDNELNILCVLYLDNIPRHNKLLVQCVRELGNEASGPCADLRIATIYSKIYKISEFDGKEEVLEISDEDYIIIED